MRKHLTNAEQEERRIAEKRLTHGKRVYLRAPEWLSDAGRTVFERTKKRMRGLELLDSLDVETLALYADAVARYQTAVKGEAVVLDKEQASTAQAWSRLALSYAEKLGISPTARARLAKRKAEKAPADELEDLLDDVVAFVNEDHG
jgi:P27 family predicted phage terminase small subunit